MKFLLTALLISFSFVAGAQKQISLEEVKDHVGDSVTVTGKVSGIRYFAEAKNAPTLINLGAAFPNQLLTVVIFQQQRTAMSYNPEEALAGQTITVSGKVELYKGKPQIIIQEEKQIVITGGK